MKILRELLIIISIFLLGEFVSKTLIIPIPGNILGMIILLVLLISKVIKLSQIETIAKFFLNHLAFFFIPAGVGLLTSFDVLKETWGRILFICIITTIIMIAVTGTLVQLLLTKNKTYRS